jgi:hypothetical protein
MHFLGVPLLHPSIGRLEGGSPYRLGRAVNVEDQRYHVSFDFDDQTFPCLLALLTEQIARGIAKALQNAPAIVRITGDLGEVTLTCRLGELEENDIEHFIPMRVVSVSR